ncbi:hypothetical protein FQZ97_658280 [compost metagenome]
MISTATMSSMIARASRNTRTEDGTERPSKARTPTAKAMSVAVGTAHPWRSPSVLLNARYNNAGTRTPPKAAIIGKAASLRLARAPSWISRRISMPTTRKNTVISASLIQKCSDFEITKSPIPNDSGKCRKCS